MQFKRKLIVSLLIGSGTLASTGAASANDSSELEELRALVQQLDQQVKVLSRKQELSEEDAVTKKKETPIVKASEKGFGLESADGQNTIKLRGLIQSDYRSYDQASREVRSRSDYRAGDLDDGINGFSDTGDSWLLRRVRPTIEGTLFGKYDFRFTPDFGGGSASVADAYIDARFDPAFKVRLGKYKSFVGLERLQSGADIKFIERSYVTNAILPNRDLGVAVHGDLLGGKLNYALGFNNGVQDGGNISTGVDWNTDPEYTARLFASPFKDDANALSGLGFGVAATYTNSRGESNLNFTDTSAADATRNGLGSYVSDGQNTIFRYNTATAGDATKPGTVNDGRRFRIAPQASYYLGPLGVIAEYARLSQDVSVYDGGSPAAGGAAVDFAIRPGTNKTLNHNAWQIAASYLITGEEASFKGVKPKQDFDLDKGGWGAWELVGRYHELNLDDDAFRNKAGTSYKQSDGAYADLSKSVKSAHSWDLGVNWYLNANARIAVNYLHTTFDGGDIVDGETSIDASGSRVRDREDERALFARFQLAF